MLLPKNVFWNEWQVKEQIQENVFKHKYLPYILQQLMGS